MSADLIDGKAFAAALRARVADQVAGFAAAAGRAPGLAVVLVGDDPASAVYVRNKARACAAAGIAGIEHRLPADTAQAVLLALIDRLNADAGVDGILVQLPLPQGLDAQAVIAAIDPAKDVDGFHPLNAGRLALGLPGFVPCTPLGCLMLLKDRLGDLAGLEAVVIGRSTIVGKPMAQLLLAENATVTLAHSRSRNLDAIVHRADIVVAAAVRLMPTSITVAPGLIHSPRTSPARPAAGLAGDVDFAGAASVAAAITPVPGGVGPMTIACLLRNTLIAAGARAGVPIDAQAL